MSVDSSKPIHQTSDLPPDDSGTPPEQTGTEKNSAIEQRPLREQVFGSNVDKAYFKNKLGTPQGKTVRGRPTTAHGWVRMARSWTRTVSRYC